MKKRRVYFIDSGQCNIQTLIYRFYLDKCKIKNMLEWDPVNPEIVFFTYSIYEEKKCFLDFKRIYSKPNRVYIMFGYQMMEPDMNIADYAIGYSYVCPGDNRHVRLPVTLLEQYDERNYDVPQNDLTYSEARSLLSKKKFCNFIYSNSVVGPMRENLFHSISKYKHVDSLGRVLHNVDEPNNGGVSNWWNDNIEKKSRYKFSIACENGYYRGCTTEKLLFSFYAHTVPIYYGNPDFGKEFNEKAVINVHNYESIEDVIQAIREVDEDDAKWIDMVCQPWQTDDQIKFSRKMLDDYYNLLEDIFDSSIKSSIRRPMGSYMHSYYMRFFDNTFNYYRRDTIKRVYKRIKAIINKETFRPWPLDGMWEENMF